MSAGEPFTPAKAAPANIVAAREVLCAHGTWLGAGGPTFLKEGKFDGNRLASGFLGSGAS